MNKTILIILLVLVVAIGAFAIGKKSTEVETEDVSINTTSSQPSNTASNTTGVKTSTDDRNIVKPPAPGPFVADAVRNLQPQTLRVGQNTITAEIRGYMFFEGETSIALYDGTTPVNLGLRSDNVSNTVVSAKGEWMTTNYVPISHSIVIPANLKGKTLTIRFIANDPSGNKPRYWGTLINVE